MDPCIPSLLSRTALDNTAVSTLSRPSTAAHFENRNVSEHLHQHSCSLLRAPTLCSALKSASLPTTRTSVCGTFGPSAAYMYMHDERCCDYQWSNCFCQTAPSSSPLPSHSCSSSSFSSTSSSRILLITSPLLYSFHKATAYPFPWHRTESLKFTTLCKSQWVSFGRVYKSPDSDTCHGVQAASPAGRAVARLEGHGNL